MKVKRLLRARNGLSEAMCASEDNANVILTPSSSLGIAHTSLLVALHGLDPLENLDECFRILRTSNLVLVLQGEMWHAADCFHPCFDNLLIDLFSSPVRLQPLLGFDRVQTRLLSCSLQDGTTGDVLLLLEITLEQFFHNLGLHLRPFGLGQLDQSVRIPRVSGLATKFEIDPDILTSRSQSIEDHWGSIGSELGHVVLAFVNACLGSIRIEIERVPIRGECVGGVRVGGFVQGDGVFELFTSDVAPRTDSVRNDGDVEVGHPAKGRVESQAGLLSKP